MPDSAPIEPFFLIIAYTNDYVLMIFTTLPAMLLLLLMRGPRHTRAPEAVQASE